LDGPNAGDTIPGVTNTTPTFPVSSGAGVWNASAVIPAASTPNAITTVRIDLNNVLQATAGVGSTAQIEKKFATVPVIVDVFIPEPASMGLALVGGALLMFRRRQQA
jgi:hypothetical protein